MKTLQEIAEIVEGRLEGKGELSISGVSGLAEAKPGEISFVAASRYLKELASSQASAVLIPEEFEAVDRPSIRVKRPYLALAKLLDSFYRPPASPPGVHPQAVLGQDVQIGVDVSIHPFVVIGNRVRLGDRVVIFPFTSIGDDCEIGEGTVLFPNVCLYPRTILGKRCIVHATSVLGADGFGFVWDGAQHTKIPQVGRVVIEDEVEIGASTCIDRATMAETRIGRGTKTDNLVQVAHNVQVGKNCILVAQAGIAGSSKLGNGVIVAAQAGVADHVQVGDGAILIAQSGAANDVPERAMVSATPAMPHEVARKYYAARGRLPDLVRQVRTLEARIAQLEEQVKSKGAS